MKKQISILMGSILLASSVQAEITASLFDGKGSSSGSSVVAVLMSDAGSYVFDTGISADALTSGEGFSIDVTAAAGDLGGGYILCDIWRY